MGRDGFDKFSRSARPTPSMPPVTQAERRVAATHLSSSGSKKKRVTEPAVVTEVARRRILRGDYGPRTPSNNRVKEAGDDLGLSERQRKELSRQLKGEPMPVSTLDSLFAQVDDSAATQSPDAAMTRKAQRIEELTQHYTEKADPLDTDPWEAPARRARGCYAAEKLGVAHKQMLLGDDWLRANVPTLIEEAERRGTTFVEFIGCNSPVEMDDEGEDSGHFRRCMGLWVNPTCMWPETILYSCPPSPAESVSAQEQRRVRHSLREEKALLEFERDLRHEREAREVEQRESEQWEHEQRVCVEVDMVSGRRAVLLDFYAGGSPQARQAAQIMRDAGVSCRTLFASSQQTDSCAYNGSKWACMLWALGPERFYQFTREQACVVLQPSFIAEQNVKLGYGHSTVARWLGCRRIMELATLDNPDGAGVDPWWLSCPAYDHFLAAFQSTISDADHYRRGGLEIMVVNTDCAGGGGHHWFVVAWVME